MAETQSGRISRDGRAGEGREGGRAGEGRGDGQPRAPPHSPLLPTPRAPSTASRTWAPGGSGEHSAMGASRKGWDMLGRRMGGAARRPEGSARLGWARLAAPSAGGRRRLLKAPPPAPCAGRPLALRPPAVPPSPRLYRPPSPRPRGCASRPPSPPPRPSGPDHHRKGLPLYAPLRQRGAPGAEAGKWFHPFTSDCFASLSRTHRPAAGAESPAPGSSKSRPRPRSAPQRLEGFQRKFQRRKALRRGPPFTKPQTCKQLPGCLSLSANPCGALLHEHVFTR